MSKRLYRLMVIGGVLSWFMVGMFLHTVLAAIDAGLTPARLDLFLLALSAILGLADASALLRMPLVPGGQVSSGEPAT